MSGSVMAILSIVAIVLIAGVTYYVVTGRKNDKVDQTEVTSKR